MAKLKEPKAIKGLKLYCNKCKRDNPKCNHFGSHVYRVRVHKPGTKKGVFSEVLNTKDLDKAYELASAFRNKLKASNYHRIQKKAEYKNYFLPDAVLQYYKYLKGQHRYAHYNKNVSDAHAEEYYKFCSFFCDSMRENGYDVKNILVTTISDPQVSDFYRWADNHYPSGKTFNKCMSALSTFFKFLIKVEKIKMDNPFIEYTSKEVEKTNIQSITKDEFDSILNIIGVADPYQIFEGTRVERKDMYRPFLKSAFKLFLLTGGRREEVVELRWSDILYAESFKFFHIKNLKVNRIQKGKKTQKKYIPIGEDLMKLLLELGYESKKETSDYIFFPERNIKSKTIMDFLSKSFTHYRKAANITRDLTLSDLRKTYISWVRAVMEEDTMKITDHKGNKVLEDHYFDKTVLSANEKAALNVKIFG